MENVIYVVEDEENIRELIITSLKSAGFTVEGFSDYGALNIGLEVQVPELIVLDVMLPGKNGYDILKSLREKNRVARVPVIFLTAKGNELDKVTGLDLGADDYIAKPFGVLELISRVKAVLRRYREATKEVEKELRYKDITINLQEKVLYKGDQKVTLTYKEYELFMYFLKNKGITLSREQLLENVWNYDYLGETRTVDSHVRSLRQKLGDNGEEQQYIQTMRGHGYMLAEERKNGR